MVISHYLVSWIQVGGLIVGLYGFFFLSISVFGTRSTPWFRALLPASGVMLGLLIAFTAPDSSAHNSGEAIPWWLWSMLPILFLLLYITAAKTRTETFPSTPSGDTDPEVNNSASSINQSAMRRKKSARSLDIMLLLFGSSMTLVLMGCVGSAVLASLRAGQPVSYLAFYLTVSGGLALAFWGEVLVVYVPRFLNEKRLLMLGFILSMFAILTQFIPPALDLLNSSVSTAR